MKTSSRARPTEGGIQVNLVPMINMVFLLLIYFLFTLSKTTQEGLLQTQTPGGQGQLSKTEEIAEEEEARVRIVRSATGIGLFFRGWPVSDLRDLARQIRPLPTNTPILIDAEPNVPYSEVVRVQNICLKTGHRNVVYTIPPR